MRSGVVVIALMVASFLAGAATLAWGATPYQMYIISGGGKKPVGDGTNGSVALPCTTTP